MKLKHVVAAAVMVLGLLAPVVSATAATSEPRDCEANSILWCGAYTKAEWQDKITKGDGHNTAADIQAIYFNQGRGITQTSFMSADTVDGIVFKDGHVEVGGKTVATGAQSIGRTNIAGSHQSGTVWERPTSVSFNANSIPAFVNMQGGVFHYAVIKSCGNAVKATPVPTPTPTPTTTPTSTPTPTPTPTPMSFICEKLAPQQKQGANFRFTITPKTEGDVTITGYRFSFSDNSPVIDTNANTAFYEREVHGELTVHGQVKTTAGISETTEACSATVTVTQQTPTPTPTTPTTGGGQVLGVTLPATGPETLLGGALGLSGIGVASQAYLRSRKNLLEALRNKRVQ